MSDIRSVFAVGFWCPNCQVFEDTDTFQLLSGAGSEFCVACGCPRGDHVLARIAEDA